MGRVLIFAPLLVSLWKCNIAGVLISLLPALIFFTIRLFYHGIQTACSCVRENHDIEMLCDDGSSLRFRLDDLESYCELPMRGRGRMLLPHSIVAKLKGVEKPVQIEVDILGWELLTWIRKNVRKAPYKAICRPASIWVDVLQIAVILLLIASYAYVGQLL